MIRTLGRRLLLTVPTLFGVLVVALLLLNVVPGDPVLEMVGERADSATIARLRAELHLDDPLLAQFGHYVWGVVRGDLGRSYITRRPIARDLAERFPKTLQLALADCRESAPSRQMAPATARTSSPRRSSPVPMPAGT